MGFQSQAGQVGFKTQAAQGAYLDPGAADPNAGIFARLRSGSLGPNRELLIPDPEIGGGRDISDAYLGAVSWSGEYDFYARSEMVALLLKGAFGSVASAAGTPVAGTNTHTITPTDSALPWLSVEEAIGDGFEVFRYTDAKVNSFHLEADANGYLMGTVGLIAREQTAGNTKTAAPNWDTNPMMVGTNITVTFGGVTLPANSFSFDVENNLEDDDFRLGSLYLGDVTEQRREVTAGFSYRPQDSALWRQAVYGAQAATTPQGTVVKGALVIHAETYEVIGATAQVHEIDINIPQAALQPFAVEPSGEDVLQSDVTIQALRPDPANPIATATVINGIATIP